MKKLSSLSSSERVQRMFFISFVHRLSAFGTFCKTSSLSFILIDGVLHFGIPYDSSIPFIRFLDFFSSDFDTFVNTVVGLDDFIFFPVPVHLCVTPSLIVKHFYNSISL